MSFSLLISLIALIVCTLCLYFGVMLFKRYNAQLEDIRSHSNVLSELTKTVNDLNEELREIRSGNYGVVSRVKELVQQVDDLQSTQQNIVEQDPQSRFYSKGVKLISQGATLEDVMRECGMPAAEAELLFNLHNNQR